MSDRLAIYIYTLLHDVLFCVVQACLQILFFCSTSTRAVNDPLTLLLFKSKGRVEERGHFHHD